MILLIFMNHILLFYLGNYLSRTVNRNYYIIDLSSQMNHVILIFLVVLISHSKSNYRADSIKQNKLTPEQIRRTVCMSLSRMHIQQHMDSIQQALDSEDQQRTRKLASILDKSFRKCMRTIDTYNLGQLQKVYSDHQYQQQEINKVFGDVQYEKNGKLVSPFSIQQQRHQSQNQRKSENATSRSITKKMEPQIIKNNKKIDKHRKRLAQKQQLYEEQQSNYQYQQQYNSAEQFNSIQELSAQTQRSSEDQSKYSLIPQPFEDVQANIQQPLQDESKSVLVYLYPLILIFGFFGYKFSSVYKKWKSGKRVLVGTLKWTDVLNSEEDLFQKMTTQKIEKVSSKIRELLNNQTLDDTLRSTLLKAYIRYLIVKLNQKPDEASLKNELKKADKELALLPFCSDGKYDEQHLSHLLLNKQALIRIIDRFPLNEYQKRSIMLGIFPYVVDAIEIFINDYLQNNPSPTLSVFQKLLFDKSQIDKLNFRMESLGMKPLKRKQYIMSFADIIAGTFGNIKLSAQIVQKILGDDYNIEEGRILFALKISQIFVYKHLDLSKNYKVVHSMTDSQIFHQYLKRQQYKNFQQLLPIFQILKTKDGSGMDYIEKHYAFAPQCSFKQTIQLFKLNFLKVYHRSATSLLKKIQEDSGEVGLFYNDILKVLHPYQSKIQVKQTLEVLKFCKIFNSYGVKTEYHQILRICKRKQQQAAINQDKAVILHQKMVSNFENDKQHKNNRLVVNDQLLDLQKPLSLFKCIDYLSDNFYKQMIPRSALYMQVYRMLLKSKKMYDEKLAIKDLITEQVLQQFKIQDTSLLVTQLDQFIENTLRTCQNYTSDQKYLDELIFIFNSNLPTDSKFKDPLKYQLIKYLVKNNCKIPACKILKKIDSSLLYLTLDNPNINEEQLYNLILQINNVKQGNMKSFQYTKQYKIYETMKAKYLFKHGDLKGGMKILLQMEKNAPSWFCNLLLEIMEEHPNTEKQLLQMAYQKAYTKSQFERIRAKYNQIYKSNPVLKQLSFKKYICEGSMLKNQQKYGDLIIEIKDAEFSKYQYKFFFVLAGTSFNHAFYYAYRKQLQIKIIDKFLNQCKKRDIIPIQQQHQTDNWMQKFVIYSMGKKYSKSLLDFVPFKQFCSADSYENLQMQTNINNVMRQLTLNADIKNRMKQEQISLVNKYYWNHKFHELQKDDNQKIQTLEKLQSKYGISVTQEAIRRVCEDLNSTKKLPYNDQFYANLMYLITIDEETFKKSIQQITASLIKIKHIVVFCKKLLKSRKHQLPLQLQEDNIIVIQSLGRIQEDNQFNKLIPPQFFYTPIQPTKQQGKVSLQSSHINRISKCLKPTNVFVLAKVMYYIYGMNQQVEEQVYRLFDEKFSHSLDTLKKFSESKQQFKSFMN